MPWDFFKASLFPSRLNKELLASKALSSQLQIEIQRKDEEYADLKEKLADAKKQIEQVQRQVGKKSG